MIWIFYRKHILCSLYVFQIVMPKSRSSFNFYTLCRKVLNLESSVSFLQEYGVLHKKVKCPKCENELSYIHRDKGTSYCYFRCSSCKSKVSIRDNTMLSHAKIGIRSFILLAYLFIMSQGLTIAQKIHEVKKEIVI